MQTIQCCSEDCLLDAESQICKLVHCSIEQLDVGVTNTMC